MSKIPTTPKQEPCWWHFPHEADVGIAVSSPDLGQAFELAAEGMIHIITDEPVTPSQVIEIHCQAPDLEGLLVDWLNNLVFEMATRRWLFGRFKVTIHDSKLTAEAWGEPVDQHRHAPAVEIKGATWTNLRVKKDRQSIWQLRCVLDV